MAESGDPLRRPRRFYTSVNVREDGGVFVLDLDGRAPRTPGAHLLAAPTRALAELIAGEWDSQVGHVDYDAMPATRLAHTALDVVSRAREQSLEGVLRYAGSDMLCYFAETPASLVRRQEEAWGPLLDWVKATYGLTFVRASGIVHRDQPQETLAELTRALERIDDFTLAGLAFSTALFGSAILALALRAGRIDAAQAMAAARLDEVFQEERWGVDAEAAARSDAMTLEAVMAERWFSALASTDQGDELVTRLGGR
jgi:chaperone required for assembly of F1-ATPase